MARREGWGGGEKVRAARRMKGVVRPQAAETRRKERVQLRREGGGVGGSGVDILGGGGVVEERLRGGVGDVWFGWDGGLVGF